MSSIFSAILKAAFAAAALLALAGGAAADPSAATVHFFRGEGCPHCAAAEPVLRAMVARHRGAGLRTYEVWYDEANAARFSKVGEALGFEATAVPTIVIGGRYWIGYSDVLDAEIEAALAACLTASCDDVAGAAMAGRTPAAAAPSPQPGTAAIDLPLIGRIDLGQTSPLVATALIAFVDGFNPCSLWVLSILVALSLHTGSRRKVLAIGLIFITVTAGVYALFIAGLYGAIGAFAAIGPVRVAVALVALVFGLVNVKDYFFYKTGLSFTIDERSKPGIYRAMRRVVDASNSFPGMAAATVALAVGVSLVEFSCTAGFPVVWTNMMVAAAVTPFAFALLLILYLVIYQLDELAIFLVAVVTLRAARVEERHGRLLKLIGGMLMATLAGAMLIDPSLLDDLGSMLAVFAAALTASALIVAVHRLVAPASRVRSGPPTG